MPRKSKPASITQPTHVIEMRGWPSPLASQRRLDPSEFQNWQPECRGDVVETVADLFRYLRRAREYLVEADRQLRIDALDEEEQAAQERWYKDMDAHDEWTGLTADAHVACTLKIIDFFRFNPTLVARYDGKPFIVENKAGPPAWEFLKIMETLADLQRDANALLVRIGQVESRH